MYSNQHLNYIYYLHSNNNTTHTNDFNYALYWLLNNILSKNNHCYITINSYTDNERECIAEGIIKFDGRYIVRCHPNTLLSEETRYSPYDTSIFYRADLSHMYLQILNNKNTGLNQQINKIEKVEKSIVIDKVENIPVVKKTSMKEEINSVLKQSQQVQQQVQQQINNDCQSDDESIATEDIDNIEKELDKMLKNQEITKEEIKKTEEELADAACEYNFKKNQENRKKEKEKELRNIFSADLNVYKKINDNYKEKNNVNLIDLVPKVFEAKFYVIKYLDDNGYLEFENINEPTEELYELYNMFYKVQFNSEDTNLENYDESFYEVIHDFLEYMTDKKVLTYEEINNYLNSKSDTVAILTNKEILD